MFGVHGDWGVGKTSFLQMVQWYLTGACHGQSKERIEEAKEHYKAPNRALTGGAYENRLQVIWFEAWRYQYEPVPIVALLQEMRAQFDWLLKIEGRVRKLGEVAIRGALLSLEDLTKVIGFQASKIEAAGEKWEREHYATALPSQTIRELLADAIGKLLYEPDTKKGAPKPRLVVMIDDLDRCAGDTAHKLLEGLKIYLTLPNCVFVLGMNQRIIEDAIRCAMKTDDKQEQKVRAAAYLEKLCQNVWRLPSVAEPTKLLLECLPDEMPSKESIGTALNDRRCLPPNPRRIKGLANLVERLAARVPAGAADKVREAKLLLIVASVYQFHHDLFVRWEYSPEYYREMLLWVRGSAPPANSPFEKLQHAWSFAAAPDTAPTPGAFTALNAYPDPTEANVFWIEPLINELGDSVSGDQFLPYLRGVAP